MMSPFDIRDSLKKINEIGPHKMTAIGHNLMESERQALYLLVLKEIAEDSIDPRSLARAALGLD